MTSEKLIAEARKFRRWNYLLDDEKHHVCENDHHRSAACEWKPLSPEDVSGMLDALGGLLNALEAETEAREKAEEELTEFHEIAEEVSEHCGESTKRLMDVVSDAIGYMKRIEELEERNRKLVEALERSFLDNFEADLWILGETVGRGDAYRDEVEGLRRDYDNLSREHFGIGFSEVEEKSKKKSKARAVLKQNEGKARLGGDGDRD